MPSPEHEQVVALLRATPVAEDESFEENRARLELVGTVFSVPEGVEVEQFGVQGIPCERLRPSAGGGPGMLLYLHGGSYTAGSLSSHRPLTARLAAACGIEAVAVDYRLAPEHPHPAGLEDARTVYRHLLDQGTAPEELVVVGDSAGGGLTAALLLHLRDEGDPLPAGAVLMSPWLDLTLSAEAVTALADEDPTLQATALARSARAYAGDDLRRPLVSPAFADPAGLPPLLILVGTAEILLDDSIMFAERAREAGVDVELDVEKGLMHVWPILDGVPEAAVAVDHMASWIGGRFKS